MYLCFLMVVIRYLIWPYDTTNVKKVIMSISHTLHHSVLLYAVRGHLKDICDATCQNQALLAKTEC